jgi:DivIVA domain-containing protein
VAGLVFLIGLLVVGGLLFLGASLLLGRGESQPPAVPGRSPVELPDDRPVVAEDVRALRISVAARGYRMTEVDWLLDQFAQVLEERDARIAALEARPADQRVLSHGATAAPQHATTHPVHHPGDDDEDEERTRA